MRPTARRSGRRRSRRSLATCSRVPRAGQLRAKATPPGEGSRLAAPLSRPRSPAVLSSRPLCGHAGARERHQMQAREQTRFLPSVGDMLAAEMEAAREADGEVGEESEGGDESACSSGEAVPAHATGPDRISGSGWREAAAEAVLPALAAVPAVPALSPLWKARCDPLTRALQTGSSSCVDDEPVSEAGAISPRQPAPPVRRLPAASVVGGLSSPCPLPHASGSKPMLAHGAYRLTHIGRARRGARRRRASRHESVAGMCAASSARTRRRVSKCDVECSIWFSCVSVW